MKKLILSMMLLLGMPVSVFAAPIPFSGIVEGFYGPVWTHEQRMDMVRFIGSKGMNTYMYAPKNDPYHRSRWREQYPKEMMDQFKELVAVANSYGVEIIFSISPGLDMDDSGFGRTGDRKLLTDKMKMMYDIGVRQFALCFDDIEEKDAIGQAELANYIHWRFIMMYEDCKPLLVVPTEYYLRDMEQDGSTKEYTDILSRELGKDIAVLFTGYEVCPDGLTEGDIRSFKSIYPKRQIGVWWNYPVNDYEIYSQKKVALGPLDKMPVRAEIEYFLVNPMDRPELSKIAIATAAEFAADPAGYDEDKAWRRAIKELYSKYDTEGSKLSATMMRLAGANQRMENDWAHIGRQDQGFAYESDVVWLRHALPKRIADEFSGVDFNVSE